MTNYTWYINVIYLRYDHFKLCYILHISPTNDFYEISVPVTLQYRGGIYQEIHDWYQNFIEVICQRYVENIALVVISQPHS